MNNLSKNGHIKKHKFNRRWKFTHLAGSKYLQWRTSQAGGEWLSEGVCLPNALLSQSSPLPSFSLYPSLPPSLPPSFPSHALFLTKFLSLVYKCWPKNQMQKCRAGLLDFNLIVYIMLDQSYHEI